MTLRDLEQRVLDLSKWVDAVEASRFAVKRALKDVDAADPLQNREWRAAMNAWEKARNERESALEVLARQVAQLVKDVRATQEGSGEKS